MGIKYELAYDIQERVNEIAKLLFPHVQLDSVVCLRSHGSSSRGTIARCHALGKAMQLALGRKGFYVIEVISRRFDKMSEIDRTKTLIHELMHIPKTFGGGFIHHDIVHEKNVEMMFQKYVNVKNHNLNSVVLEHAPKCLEVNKEHFGHFKKKEGFVNSIIKGEGVEKAREASERVEIENLKKRWWF